MIRARAISLGLALLVSAAVLVAQMPDARQMSGIPMPVTDTAPGTIVVRVVKDSLTSNIPNHAVELLVGTATMKATTDAEGRAQFTGVTVGATVRAMTVVGDKRIQSEPFQVPAAGGIRLILAASAAEGAAGEPGAMSAGAKPGDVVLGGDSRIQVEFDDDSLTVYYLLEFINGGNTPATPAKEIVFDLPADAEQPTLLEGSSTQAQVRGHRVSVTGPFDPGRTPVQLAYSLAPAGPARALVQAFPVPWMKVQVIATYVPGLSMVSSQFTQSGEVPGDNHTFLLGTGDALAATAPLTVSLGGLPSRNRTGRYVALSLALLVLLAGAWMVITSRARAADTSRRAELEQRRARLLADVARLEQQPKTTLGDEARAKARREDLIAQLERVYGELDQQGGASGEGLPA